MITTDKQSIARLVYICEKRGIKNIVFSPGSRNAALIIAFTKNPHFNCFNIPDERVAAFFAMGMALQTQVSTIICCTSGTAALNYAPAICEAYYQRIPLFVITADRPVELIDQGIGQSMRQKDVYRNYIDYSAELIQEAHLAEDLIHNDQLVNLCLDTAIFQKGPVHLNCPFHEPLYSLKEYVSFDNVIVNQKKDEKVATEFSLMTPLEDVWKNSKKKMLIVGQGQIDQDLKNSLDTLVAQGEIVLLTETCSNIYVDGAIHNIDRVINSITKQNNNAFCPDLLVYLGGQIISKRIKKLFSHHENVEQWHVGPSKSRNTFGRLTAFIRSESVPFLNAVSALSSPNNEDYQNSWHALNLAVLKLHEAYFQKETYSDLHVFQTLLKCLPNDVVLHMANSTVVRYVQLCNQRADIIYQANRGVSGIDGCTSTAIGYSYFSERNNVLITGDVSFLYDSNAFWHHHHPRNLKIVLINNQGGGIFRIIDGPSDTQALATHFEAHHQYDGQHIANMYALDYTCVDSMEDFNKVLPEFFKTNSGMALLEVKTPREQNDVTLKSYFDSIRVQ